MHLDRLSRSLAALAAFAAAALAFAANTDAPPAFTDAEHVYNGCHLSAVAYLARFSAEFPTERGEPAVLVMANADGVRRPHTVALVTWNGEWFGRDEYFGTFRLGFKVDANPSAERLEARAASVLARLSARKNRTAGYRRPPMVRGELSPSELVREVATAARILPFPSSTFWLKDGAREYPVVLFRPSADTVAVYDPHRGTAVAECASRDDAGVVGLVAARLGYSGGVVRAEAPVAAAVVAMAR